ncbi:MAG: response regulator transcription factor [Granulosicoccus sp.]
MRILLVEDHEQLGKAVSEQIVSDGHALDWMKNYKDASACLLLVSYDLILLDMMLPDGQGIDLLRGLRKRDNRTPVIIITALDQITDRIAGLNAGADDYLVKPFDLSELSARIAAVARRYGGNPNPLIVLGDLQINLVEHSLLRAGKAIDLTPREWTLFEALLQRTNVVLSKNQLEEYLYEFGAEIESNTVEVHISRLRKKIGRHHVVTIRGIGYRINQTAIA